MATSGFGAVRPAGPSDADDAQRGTASQVAVCCTSHCCPKSTWHAYSARARRPAPPGRQAQRGEVAGDVLQHNAKQMTRRRPWVTRRVVQCEEANKDLQLQRSTLASQKTTGVDPLDVVNPLISPAPACHLPCNAAATAAAMDVLALSLSCHLFRLTI